MRHLIYFIRVSVIFTLIVFSSCDKKPISATEIENEFRLISISGVVAVGSALASQKIYIYSSDTENKLGETITDEQGKYRIQIQVSKDEKWCYLRAEDFRPNEFLSSAAYLGEENLVIAHINPLTNWWASEILNNTTQIDLSFNDYRELARKNTHAIFGPEVQWEWFYNDAKFSAYSENGKGKPSGADILLHSLMDRVRSNDQTLEQFSKNQILPLFYEEDFVFTIIENSIQLGMDSLSFESDFQIWMENREELNLYLEEYRERKNNFIGQGKNPFIP
jgi:hypothetical protein